MNDYGINDEVLNIFCKAHGLEVDKLRDVTNEKDKPEIEENIKAINKALEYVIKFSGTKKRKRKLSDGIILIIQKLSSTGKSNRELAKIFTTPEKKITEGTIRNYLKIEIT
jgi:hypothetical protein